jgi:hypothetical protein
VYRINQELTTAAATSPGGVSPHRARLALLFEPAIELLAADPDAATDPDEGITSSATSS